MQVLQVMCEWDIGQDDILFGSVEAAEKWLDTALIDHDFEESREELEGEGLINYEWKLVIQ